MASTLLNHISMRQGFKFHHSNFDMGDSQDYFTKGKSYFEHEIHSKGLRLFKVSSRKLNNEQFDLYQDNFLKHFWIHKISNKNTNFRKYVYWGARTESPNKTKQNQNNFRNDYANYNKKMLWQNLYPTFEALESDYGLNSLKNVIHAQTEKTLFLISFLVILSFCGLVSYIETSLSMNGMTGILGYIFVSIFLTGFVFSFLRSSTK